MEEAFFENPQWAWAFLILAAVALLLGLYLRWKRGLIKQLGQYPLVRAQMPGFSWRRQWAKAGLVLAALALLITSLLNWQRPVQNGNRPIEGIDMVFALDVSNSMLATDVAPNRLERAKLLMTKLADTLSGNRIGMVAFAGQAFLQLPLTTDVAAARLFIAGANTQSIPIQGTNIALALQEAAATFGPASSYQKVVVLFTDGEEHDADALALTRQLTEQGIVLLTVGVGSPNGATITTADGEAIYTEEGQPVVSRLNEKLLTQLASQTKGKYFALTNNMQEVANSITAALANVNSSGAINSMLINYKSSSHLLMAIAVLLLLLDLWLPEWVKPRVSSKKATAKKPAQIPVPQPTAVALLFVLLMWQWPALGQNANGSLRKAHEAYTQGRLGAADTAYRQILAADSNKVEARFQLGNIAHLRKEFADAQQAYSQVLQQQDKSKEAAIGAWNNKGLTYVQQQNLPKAIEAFKQAVRLNPYDTEVRDNLLAALRDWQRQMQQEKQQNDNSNQPDKKPKQQSGKFNKQEAQDKLQALQQEEKRIRQNMQKQQANSHNKKNW